MKNASLNIAFGILLILGLLSCSNSHVVDSLIELTPKKVEKSVHVGLGVWMVMPSSYYNAKSFNGYQNADGRGSISVEVKRVNLNDVRNTFRPEVLKHQKTELLEYRPVTFGESDSSLFIVVQDNRKGTVRYLLAINEGSKTYLIKAFCFQKHYDSQNGLIRNAMFSTYIGEAQEKDRLFKLAAVSDITAQVMTLTKDGKYPTEHEDGSTIIVSNTENRLHDVARNFVQAELLELTGKKIYKFSEQSLMNGNIVSGQAFGETTKAYVVLISLREDTATLIKAYGNQKAKMFEFMEFVRLNYTKTSIVPKG